MRHRIRAMILVGFGVLAALPPALASGQGGPAPSPGGGELVVPSPRFPTIQSAIDAAADGGAIRIRPGVYRETLTISGKRLRITGAGARAPRTEIAQPVERTVDDAAGAIGVVNYREGGGGVLEGVALRGGLNGIVGQTPSTAEGGGLSPSEGGVAPRVSGSLALADVAITDTGRGILWRTGTNLTARNVTIARTRRHGLAFRSFAPAKAALRLFDVDISQVAGYGVLIRDTGSVGCSNQLSGVDVSQAIMGGIGVFRSGVCIFNGTLSHNRLVGLYLEQSDVIVDGTLIEFSTAVSGVLGVGILAVLSNVQHVSNTSIQRNDLAALSMFGGQANLDWNNLFCNPIDLDVEILPQDFFGPGVPPAPSSVSLGDDGGNFCLACNGTVHTCSAVSSTPSPPSQQDIE